MLFQKYIWNKKISNSIHGLYIFLLSFFFEHVNQTRNATNFLILRPGWFLAIRKIAFFSRKKRFFLRTLWFSVPWICIQKNLTNTFAINKVVSETWNEFHPFKNAVQLRLFPAKPWISWRKVLDQKNFSGSIACLRLFIEIKAAELKNSTSNL